MLSKRYLAIKSFLTKVSKIEVLHKRIRVLAQLYIDIDKGFRFSYLPDENGEIELLQTLNKLYNGKLIFFDVGAHLGTYTDMIVDGFEDYDGHLFEISNRTFEKCVERLGGNPKLTINSLGLSDSAGEVEIRYYPDDPTRSGIAGVAAEANFTYEIHKAQCTTGSMYCREKNIDHIDLLKIDAEGYDLHVLRGFDELMTKGAIDIIQFEYNHRHGDVHVAMRDFYEYLTSHNYQIGVLRQSGVEFKAFEPQDNNFERGPNFIACQQGLCGTLRYFKFENDRKQAPLAFVSRYLQKIKI